MKNKNLILLLILLGLNACLGDIDTSKIDDIAIENEVRVSLFHFTLPNNHFLDTNNDEIITHTESFNTPILSDLVNPDYITRVKLYLLINNTFDRSFTVKLIGYDDSQTTTSLTFNDLLIPANASNFEHEYIIENNDIEALKNTSKVNIEVTLNPSSSTIQPDENKQLNVKSSLTLYNTYYKQ